MKDAIIILGGGVTHEGALTALSRMRVDEGVRLFESGISLKIIMSGRHGLWLDWKNNIPLLTEAAAMQKYAVSLGISPRDIILEENSKDTLGNAYFTKVNILEPKGWSDVGLVTSDFHLPRARYDFNLVLGPKYKIEYFSSDSCLPEQSLQKLVIQEGKNMKVFSQLVGGNVGAGDSKAIQTILFSKHPGYARAPELTYEKLWKLFE